MVLPVLPPPGSASLPRLYTGWNSGDQINSSGRGIKTPYSAPLEELIQNV